MVAAKASRAVSGVGGRGGLLWVVAGVIGGGGARWMTCSAGRAGWLGAE